MFQIPTCTGTEFCHAWAARIRAAIMRPPESVCSESVRPRGRDAEGAISARKRSGPRTAGGGLAGGGFWGEGKTRKKDPPRRGSGPPGKARLISQVTGQKGGRHP